MTKSQMWAVLCLYNGLLAVAASSVSTVGIVVPGVLALGCAIAMIVTSGE